jgi:hypothetical protein
MTSGATSRVTSRATRRGTRTRGGGKVVDDEPARGGVVDDERREEPRDESRDVPRHPDARRCRSSRRRPRDEPRDVPKQLQARLRKIDSVLTGARRHASMDLGESMSRFILLTRVLRIRPVVIITPTWRASCRCFRPANLPRGYPR